MEVEVTRATVNAAEVLAEMDPKGELDNLVAWVSRKMKQVLFILALAGYGRARVIEGYREPQRAEQLYGQGRTPEECALADVPEGFAAPEENVVTWILPRYNLHTRGRALDVDLTMYTGLDFDAIESIARSSGVVWGGGWSVRDTYHFEV